MPKMNDTIAKQARAVRRMGGSLSEFFRAKGINPSTGRAYLSKKYKKQLTY
jgi:hypothetical protein